MMQQYLFIIFSRRSAIVVLTVLLAACSWVGNYVRRISTPSTALVEEQPARHTCSYRPQALSIFASDMDETMERFLQRCHGYSDSPLKKCFLDLAIYQMILRPDELNPYSQVTLIHQQPKQIRLLSSTANNSITYWQALQYMAQQWNLTAWFQQEVQRWIQTVPIEVKVGKVLAKRLEKLVPTVKASRDEIERLYKRGEELVTEGENLSYQKALQKVQRSISSNKSLITPINSTKLPWSHNEHLAYSCNFDLNALSQGALQSTKQALESRTFAVKLGSEAVVMVAYGKIPADIKDSDINAYFLNNQSGPDTANDEISQVVSPEALNTPAPPPTELVGIEKTVPVGPLVIEEKIFPKYCFLQWNKDTTLLVSSHEGRDPAQFIYNLLRYLEGQEPKSELLEQLMAFPRHLILQNPLRLGFEVKAATTKHLESVLSLGIPTFQQDKLGNLLMLGDLKQDHIFITDPRGEQLTCSLPEGKKHEVPIH